jgi:hypothetical protein
MGRRPMPTDDCGMEAPFARVRAHDGRYHLIWRNPSDRQVAGLIAGSPHAQWGARAVLTEHDLYLWHSPHVLHGDFLRQIGLDAMRIRLQPDIVLVNDETAGIPSAFPWIFRTDGNSMDVDCRREIVERWLITNSRLRVIYPRGLTVNWYM